MIEDRTETWIAGQLALTLLAVDPDGLGGLHLRARAGAVRDALMRDMPEAEAPLSRIAPGIADGQLFGGIDIAATLSAGRVVRQDGLLARPRRIVLTMAERCPTGLAARLAQSLDRQEGHSLILLDEGAEPEERAPAALVERLAFSLDLDGLRVGGGDGGESNGGAENGGHDLLEHDFHSLSRLYRRASCSCAPR